ncbi:MAG: guanylate kinase [Planctomycetes bacterium]|nr:guanylate kinase [Planctomycetota bacterium]
MLFVISGPSGSGKTTVLAEVVKDTRVRRVVTATTRAPRPGEVNGKSYWFHTEAEFFALRDSGALLEWAENYGCWYGTPRSEVERKDDSRLVVADLDPQGFRALRSTGLKVIGIFVAPPSIAILSDRLGARGTETEIQKATRLGRAASDMAAAAEYDAVVVNDTLETAVSAVKRHMGLAS